MHFRSRPLEWFSECDPWRTLRPSQRIPQMHKKVVGCFRRWHGREVQINGLLPTCDRYPSSPNSSLSSAG